jgi:hypothetical protein
MGLVTEVAPSPQAIHHGPEERKQRYYPDQLGHDGILRTGIVTVPCPLAERTLPLQQIDLIHIQAFAPAVKGDDDG